MASPKSELLTSLLRDVSRSFYTTLRILPRAIRPQIGLAYLLARATDTIADTPLVPVARRLEALQQLRRAIACESGSSLPDLAALMATQPGSSAQPIALAERRLLERVGDALALLASINQPDRTLIQAVLETITGGQTLDLERFGAVSASGIVALGSDEELDDYTYRVAGCVGEFWTRMCRAHLFPRASLDDRRLLEDGIRFGQGLQLVNVLRDLPQDLRQGRCYLPASSLAQLGLAPPDLLEPSNERKLRPLYDAWLERAEGHLEAGWRYTNTLPRGSVRVRLACAWPVLIGMRTLARLRTQPILGSGGPIKISRSEVRNLIARSVLLYPVPSLWRGLFARASA